MDQQIYLLGLNHRTADVEIREKFALGNCTRPDGETVQHFPLGGPIKEIMVLSTCNRVELLAVGPSSADEPDDVHSLEGGNSLDVASEPTPAFVLDCWARSKGMRYEDLAPYVYTYRGLDAVTHLFSVGSSLDSMVLGEPQILGQLKDAYRAAVKQGATGVILNRVIHKAFSVAKRVRTETAVASSAVSISYAAVELAKRIFGQMQDYKAMLIGAGEMAELAAVHLVNAGIQKIFVANRTFQRAEELARQMNGEAIVFEELFRRLADVDIVISSTGAPQAILSARDIKDVLRKRKNKPMFFIDIAVPRDIDPDVNSLDNVYLYDIDDLKEVVEENLAQRREEAAKARAIVETEATAFGTWLKALDLQPTIVDMLDRGETIARRELARTMKRLGPDMDTQTRDALECMATAIARKLFHEPIVFLKRRSAEEDSVRRYIDMTRRMFNLDDDAVPPDAHLDRRAVGPSVADADFDDDNAE
ncbi:MAG: glutamyl-tRNA reductase [Desulfovibrionaceae bacterium]